MRTTQKFIKANQSQKNGKTYVELLNEKNYSKLIFELAGQASVNGLNAGDNVNVEFDLSGDGFKPRLSIIDIKKVG